MLKKYSSNFFHDFSKNIIVFLICSFADQTRHQVRSVSGDGGGATSCNTVLKIHSIIFFSELTATQEHVALFDFSLKFLDFLLLRLDKSIYYFRYPIFLDIIQLG